ncbi:MAG: 1,6-anhydro-N-acetylmuramyl-L-alanine amidase AmpD [Hydrogenophilus sp.]|nr:1,6-anhydro-N-acetylmuramyl-L-alanine amidase AmpD [Hydrogenophilus sp.]
MGAVKGTVWPVDRKVASPFCDERPPGAEVTLAVIHAISLPPGVFAGDAVERFFSGRLPPAEHPFFAEIMTLRVSAHFFVRRSGETIEFVAPERRAWHAGVSCWRGQSRCNDFSVGIELEGDERTPFSVAQYARLVALLQALRDRFPKLREVVGHCHVAPGRKRDPGPYFQWDWLRRQLTDWEVPTGEV